MKPVLFSVLFLVSLLSRIGLAAKATDEEVASRAAVIDLAGAFQNDGFKIRDGNLAGQVSSGHPKVVSVNLFSGNAYWFTVAASKNVEGLSVTLFDETGKPVGFQPFQQENRAAAGFSPDASGLYYVKVSADQSQPATFCLIYSYK